MKRASLRQKNGGSFRFHLIVICDKKNRYTVQQVRGDKEVPQVPRESSHSAEYKRKKALHEERLKATKVEPQLPRQYTSGHKGKGLVTHIDVAKFKELWESHLCEHDEVCQSREEGVRYQSKHELRFALAEFAIANGVTKSRK